MDFQPILYIFVAMAIITWIFWLVKKGLINPDNFIKDRPQQPKKPDNNTKQIQVEIIK